MKNVDKIIACISCMLLMFFSCERDESIKHNSEVILDKLLFSGYTGDMIRANVTYGNSDIKKLVITKWVNGEQVPGYEINVPVNSVSDTYEFEQEIEVGDEEGTLIYTFSGYSKENKLIDASDLAISVTLTDFGRLSKFDWRLTEQTTNGDDTTTDAMLDNVYRLNNDLSWEYDWGDPAGAGMDVLNQYCAWKYVGTDLKADSIYLIRYGFLSNTPTIDKYAVLRLDDANLWIQTFMDLSWLGDPYTEETPVIEKFVAVPKSSGFTPYRGENPANYSWASCTPGNY
ncbi:MAG: hypothetical protein LLF81_12955 [Porphyromonadaceae bacterium]|nr:hypothetical protein [Porphyromonadaceae bacterium]